LSYTSSVQSSEQSISATVLMLETVMSTKPSVQVRKEDVLVTLRSSPAYMLEVSQDLKRHIHLSVDVSIVSISKSAQCTFSKNKRKKETKKQK
jgi:hypothetical protein